MAQVANLSHVELLMNNFRIKQSQKVDQNLSWFPSYKTCVLPAIKLIALSRLSMQLLMFDTI